MKHLLLIITLLNLAISVKAQTGDPGTKVKPSKAGINDKTIVKDSTGRVLPFAVWMKMAVEEGYTVRPEHPGSDSTAYIMVKMTPEQFENYKKVLTSQKGASANVVTKNVNHKLTDKTIVKDSAGNVLPVKMWKELTMSGDYRLRPENMQDENSPLLLVKISAEEKQLTLKRAMEVKPAESKYFTTGEAIRAFEVRDITGKKITAGDWVGKTVVLNYWFINCPPCRREMPELNKIVEKYKDNPNVLFIGFALDSRGEIRDFLKTTPYNYRQVADGREYAQLFGITSYPTNVVVDKEGKVQFHASGYSVGLPYWLEKAIAESEAKN